MDDGDSCGSGGDGSCGDSGGDLKNVNKKKITTTTTPPLPPPHTLEQ